MIDSFSLLTLNCFGLWLPNTERRLLSLAQKLDRQSHPVVCLQEIQLHRYQELLVKACSSYPYSYHERYVHCPKGGLLTLSRLPFTDKSFEPYEERGSWYTPMLLDRLFYKGMLVTKLYWEDLYVVIINTHILANFMGDWERNGIYARVEEKQLQQLATTVRSQSQDSLVLVVGDFNIPRGGRLYSDFLESSGLTDPLAGDPRPTLRAPVMIPSQYPLAIDYVLYRLPSHRRLTVECDLWASGKLSDHDGIEVHITAN